MRSCLNWKPNTSELFGDLLPVLAQLTHQFLKEFVICTPPDHPGVELEPFVPAVAHGVAAEGEFGRNFLPIHAIPVPALEKQSVLILAPLPARVDPGDLFQVLSRQNQPRLKIEWSFLNTFFRGRGLHGRRRLRWVLNGAWESVGGSKHH